MSYWLVEVEIVVVVVVGVILVMLRRLIVVVGVSYWLAEVDRSRWCVILVSRD